MAKKTAIVSGGATGIGAGVVHRLCADGYSVMILYHHSKEKAEALLSQLIASGCDAAICHCDVASTADAEAAVRVTAERFGTVDLLVTCAGIAKSGLLTDHSDGDVYDLMNVNFGGTLRLCRAVYPYMVAAKSGCIVTVSSVWGEAGASCESVYASSKGAVIALTKSLSAELAPSGIRVNCVSPGVIRTDMLNCYSEEDLSALAADTPLLRLGTPQDVADAVSFLAASPFVTGQVLRVDGGFLS